MKNTWIASLITILLIANVSAQEETSLDYKKRRFGLIGSTSLGWLKPDDERNYSSDGVRLGFGWGLQVEFNIGKTTSFVTGINMEVFKASLNYYDDELSPQNTYYALNSNYEFINWEEDFTSPGTLYHLKKRDYKINYVNIPLILKMKTKEIGYFTYFGEFGAVLGFKTKAKVTDVSDEYYYDPSLSEPFEHVSADVKDLNDLDLAKGTKAIRTGLRVGGGAEYNISGTTFLFFSLQYNYFISNALTKESKEELQFI